MPVPKGNVLLRIGDRWKVIPVNAKGDPEFKTIDGLLDVFTREEIIILVNRALYAAKYQREHHDKRRALQKGAKKEDVKEGETTAVERASIEFSRRLLAEIGRENLSNVVREENPMLLHDYCDANEVMSATLTFLKLPVWLELIVEDSTFDQINAANKLWEDAWALAESKAFYLDILTKGGNAV